MEDQEDDFLAVYTVYTSALTTSENVSGRSRREGAKFPHSPPKSCADGRISVV